MGWVVNAMPRPIYSRERDPVPTVQEVGWAPGPVWTGAVNLAPTGIRSPDLPTRSESLYRLCYPGPWRLCSRTHINTRVLTTVNAQIRILVSRSARMWCCTAWYGLAFGDNEYDWMIISMGRQKTLLLCHLTEKGSRKTSPTAPPVHKMSNSLVASIWTTLQTHFALPRDCASTVTNNAAIVNVQPWCRAAYQQNKELSWC